MIDWLAEIDRTVFLFINRALANPVTDALMPAVTNDTVLRILMMAIIVSLLAFGRKRLLWVVVFSFAVVALSDQSSSAWLKPLFERLRPCKVMDVHLLVGCGAGYSFPSSHAANLFGQAVFFGLLYKKYLPYLLAFAFLIGVSRIFVGVHYPLDVVAGMILGCFWGGAAAWMVWTLSNKRRLKPEPGLRSVFTDRTDT